MQMIGFATVVLLGLASFAALSVRLYAALPEIAFEYAARHGRYRGLGLRELPPAGTRSGHPPIGSLGILQGQPA